MAYGPNPNRYEEINYRRCGRSGILLPAISLGLWHNFGHTDNYQNGVEIVSYAFDNGITHFDLANNYGPPPGAAEENFGRMMHERFKPYRSEMFIVSKAAHRMWPGPYGDGGSRKNLMNSIDQSLKRMRLDYVDLFYSHRYDPETPLEETLTALVDIVKQGKALYVGLSKYPIDQLKLALTFLQENGVPCLAYQDRYNMLVRNPEYSHFQFLKEQNIGFVAFSPLAQGLLTDRYLKGIPQGSRAAGNSSFLTEKQITPELIEKLTLLQSIAEKRGQSLAEMALAWTLKESVVSTVIVGASSVDQLQRNMAALKIPNFSNEELKKIEEILK